jgi:hypothetical protein
MVQGLCEMKKLSENRFAWGTPVEYVLIAIVVSVSAVWATGVSEKVFAALAQAAMLSGIAR